MTDSNSMHSRLSSVDKILKILLPLGVSAAFVIWLFHKVNISEVFAVIKEGVDYRYLFGMSALMILSYVIRGIRWGLQLRAAGVPRLPVMTESVSIFGAYALNMVFTYLGEAWRCIYISRLSRTKLSTIVGTDIGDRGSDAVMILLISCIALFVARPALDSFAERYHLADEVQRLCTDGSMWLIIAGITAAVGFACYLLRNTTFIQKLKASLQRLWTGFAVLFRLKSWPLYVILTIGIWVCYFLETYMCFWAFPFTRELISAPGMAYGLIPGLVVFVFGSFSIAIPSNGGLGPWNIAVTFALTLYGVSEADGTTYSLVCWAFQAATLIILGIFSAIYVTVRKHRHSGVNQLQR